MSSQKPKITFLVGAGLVFDAGLPLSNDLTKKFREHLSEQVAGAVDHRRYRGEGRVAASGALRALARTR